MAADFFMWDKCSSLDFGLCVQQFPTVSAPARKQEKISVPGRSGELIVTQDAFENVSAAYDVYFNAKRRMGTVQHSHAVAAWLLFFQGYTRLEDSYDSARYRLAAFAGPLEVENDLNAYGRCVINFDCKPQRYAKSGEYPVTLTARGTVYNPERFAALPLITVYGTGSGRLSVGGTVVELKSIDGFVTLDSEMQNAYRQTQNKNSTVVAPVFPQLVPGANEVSFSGGVSRVEIVPRWWTL